MLWVVPHVVVAQKSEIEFMLQNCSAGIWAYAFLSYPYRFAASWQSCFCSVWRPAEPEEDEEALVSREPVIFPPVEQRLTHPGPVVIVVPRH